MSWVESATTSFVCRHSSVHAEDAARVLVSLEAMRTRLERYFPRTVDELTVVRSAGAAGVCRTLSKY